jgi:hypothetical protein
MPQYSDHQNSLIGDDQAAEVFTQYDSSDLVYVNQAFEVVGEDMDTMAASNHEEPLPCEFEELLGIYTDSVFDDDPRYS